MNRNEKAAKPSFRYALALALLAWVCILATPASLGAQATRPAGAQTVVQDDSDEKLEQFRQKKLLALYLTALILLLLVVFVLIMTMRIRYKVDKPVGPTEELEDLWFKKKDEDT